MDGVQTGIKPLDNELLKIYYGTLTILSGRPGSGKNIHCRSSNRPYNR